MARVVTVARQTGLELAIRNGGHSSAGHGVSEGGLVLDTPVQMAPVDPAAVETLLADLEAAGYFELERSYLPADTCCDRILYLISAEQDGRVHTVEALEATPDLPPAVGESVTLIETFVAGAFGE